jgi:hypothetical protein
MWRRVVRGLVLVSIALLVPAAFAQEFIGSIDQPLAGQTVSGAVMVSGFALDIQAISRIDLFVDDQFQHSATINIPRIDLIEVFPDWEGIHERLPGFLTGFLASRFPNGPHTIHVVVLTDNNRTVEVGRRTIIIDNTINQAPIGWVDHPGITAVHDVGGSFPVSGWAIDTDGVARIDVQIDNLNQQSAVYGDPNPGVHNVFQDFPAAMFSSWIAHIDSSRIQDGVHTLVVRATDRRGLSRVLGRRNIQVFNSTNNLRPFGTLDEPLRDAVLFGTCGVTLPPGSGVSPSVPFLPQSHITPVRGWALDLGTREDLGRVSYVELLVDGVRWFSTDDCRFEASIGGFINCYGMPRFDVARYYPTYPDSPRSGYMFAMDVGVLVALGVPQGRHVLKVRVGDQEQTFADIPNTSGIPVWFTCADRTQDFPSRGFIDYPQNMEFLNGTVTFSGWATDDNQGIQLVEIFVDGNFMGPAQYGLARPDVAAVFPTLAGAQNSGWRFTIDTRQLSDSRHRLTVTTLDRANNRSELGSADFFVDNP